MINLPSELRELSKIFLKHGKKLYIVGGFVRDSYLNVQSLLRNDIDLCSNVTPNDLIKILKNTKFAVEDINKKLGVMAILGERRYEHATFRKEKYTDDSHIPVEIDFIGKLEEDAKRRDFKINALYYDIEDDGFIDPLGAIEDLRNNEITTVKSPQIVFNDDPERILRLVRFACSLGLKIPEEEMYYAKLNAYKIKFISKYRLRNEFEKLISADQVYPELIYTRTAHYRAMRILGELNIWKFILPSMQDMYNSPFVDKKGEPLYEHILNSLKNASPRIRLAVLLHDVGKVKTKEISNTFFGSNDFVPAIVEENLGINGLGYSKKVSKFVSKIIIGYDFNNKLMASKRTIRKFIIENKDVIEDIIEIKSVIKNEGKTGIRKIKSAEILKKHYKKMLIEKAPFAVTDLDIKGDDIIRLIPKIKIENIDELLDAMLVEVALKPKKNNKKDLEILANKLTKSNRDFYIEE